MESFDNVVRPLKTLLESEEQGSADGAIPSEPAPRNIDIKDTKQNGNGVPFVENLASRDPSHNVPMFDEDTEGGDEEPNVANSFERTSSPSTGAQRSRYFLDGKVGDDWVSRMHKFSLYETSTRYYMVGMDLLEQRFRILKIERTSAVDDLNISEDDTVYTKSEMNHLLDAVDDGNKSSGGLKLRCSSWGLLGFIRFTGPYYMILVTRRSQVAMIGGHYIYQIDGTELIPLTSTTSARTKSEKSAEEARFITIMSNVDLTRSFYFSYSYNITRTLQRNISYERQRLQKGPSDGRNVDHNTMFVWNYYMLEPVVSLLKNAFDWCLPIIHGYVDQSMICVYGRLVYVTIIARRSRFFAGARFLKRGANDLGYVANDVETEQIVSEMLTTSFHSPGPKLYANPQYTSYVQHRGSIPLHWTQDSTGVSPKPDIELSLVDPFYSAAALHFNNLFERYGAPVYVLNLIKARERVARESKLLTEFTNAITYLNQFLPEDKKILYKAWDMSRASKSRDQDVIGTLEDIAEDIIPETGFFRNGDDIESGLRLQNGVARTNCIDCLDRTNAAQFVIGKRALGYQLHALGIIDGTSVQYDTDAMNLFTAMWHHHGDTIAVQYGGSHLVNTMATYRKINQWTGHSRDMVESVKRYYNNSFLDAQRQEAYNLFLGNYIFSQSQPMLWELATDYYLHHSHPRVRSNKCNYIDWFNPEYLKPQETSWAVTQQDVEKPQVDNYDDYWLEYYRPLAISSFSKIFSNKMKSTIRYLPFRSIQDPQYDLSPFVVRVINEPDGREKKPSQRKGVTIQEPSDLLSEDPWSTSSRIDSSAVSRPIQNWLQQPPSAENYPPQASITKLPRFEFPDDVTTYNANHSRTPSKSQLIQWSLDELVYESLHPSVSAVEAEEYERYINHPLKVPLVVTSEDTLAAASLAERGSNLDLFEYANKCAVDDANLDLLAEDNLPDYLEFVNVNEEGLTVIAEDHNKKRYKRYRQWLRGKSLFKQRVDS
ncbi:polyphosphoinositide phosphatase Fig4 [Histoplasma capsulatum]|uniref:Polyphosphoinositide phosphatase Fig4 n=1 Tax=Ajellomyces capsulatus TaxID=5037 RepID=A0A8A1M1S4_AJECA|nr:polyphosphoinositide phosphatase Fig4 [Histoplasma capsulatum]